MKWVQENLKIALERYLEFEGAAGKTSPCMHINRLAALHQDMKQMRAKGKISRI
jgi:hypothetical protein